MTSESRFASLLGAIVWNLITWWLGLPSSSSHALIGGLCGGALAATSTGFRDLHWNVILWSQPNAQHWYKGGGLLWKVIVPMFLSPALGFVLGFIIMAALYVGLRNQRPSGVNRFFRQGADFQRGGDGFHARHQ